MTQTVHYRLEGRKRGLSIRSWLMMGGILFVTAVLTRLLPFSEFFRNVNTLIHEMAHAVVTLLLSGDVMYIYLFSDQSGVTLSSYSGKGTAVFIALAGYVGSSLFTVLLFYLYARRRERLGLVVVTILAAIGLALFVRNGYGMAWCAGFGVLTGFIYAFAPPWLKTGYYTLIAFIFLVESVISSFVILSLSFVKPEAAGDAAILGQMTVMPAFAWSLLFVVFALWCAKVSTGLLFRRGFGKE